MRELSLLAIALTALAPVLSAQEPQPSPEPQTDTPYEANEQVEAEEEEYGGYQYLEEELIADALEAVLSRPEFERLRDEPEEPEESETPSWLEGFFDWLDDWLGSRDTSDSRDNAWFPGLPFFDLLVYGAAAAVFTILIIYILRAIVGSKSSKKLRTDATRETPIFRADRAPGEEAPGEYWQRALALAQSHDYRGAVREILLASMSTLERRGSIRFRKGLTNRDYFYAAKGVPREAFAVIAQTFELIYFGRREATADGFRACKEAFERGFRRESTP